MALDEKDKQRIEAEEAYRTQLREQTGSNAIPQSKKKGMGCLGWFLIIFFGIPILIVVVTFTAINPSKQIDQAKKVVETSQNGGSQNSNTTPAPEKQNTFVAYVNFKDGEFIISNLDEHPCQDARMKVNGQYSLDGYNLESALDSTVKTGTATVYRVGAGQFVKGDGTRLNPFTTKPLNFNIYCRGNNKLTSATWYGEF